MGDKGKKSPVLIPGIEFKQVKSWVEMLSKTETRRENDVWMGMDEIMSTVGIC